MNLHHGDCVEVMAGMDPESVDAIVTDPPYGLAFMAKEWDSFGPSPSTVGELQPGPWNRRQAGAPRGLTIDDAAKGNVAYGMWSHRWAQAAYRVAKPSAYLLAFGGTRTVHRMTVALEDAGWIIRDMLVWGYASGFPKSKASLKPAWEPIVMARKPGPLRMLAIDECRIGFESEEDRWKPEHHRQTAKGDGYNGINNGVESEPPVGRWPANIVLTDPIFDGGIEGVVGGGEQSSPGTYHRNVTYWESSIPPLESLLGSTTMAGYGDSGTYSRFFLIPKAARSDREPVLGGLPLQDLKTMGAGEWTKHGPGAIQRQNVHPTVKPTDLMRHLVRLVTPTGGVVLDPFLGSGTTALAAEMEGFDWIGIEREAEYVAIAEARLNGTQRGLGLDIA